MTPDLALCCPACRWADPPRALRPLRPAASPSASEDLPPAESWLLCEHPDCGAHYPVVAGIPLLHPHPLAFARQEAPALGGELQLGVGRGWDYLCAYSYTAWAEPDDRVDGPALGEALAGYRGAMDRAIEAVLAAARGLGPGAVADLGCGLGRELRRLAGGGLPTLGLELRFEALREVARGQDSGAPRWVERRPGRGLRWRSAREPAGLGHAQLVLADALWPPLASGSLVGALAVNLLDSIPEPERLLEVCAELLAPGALLLVVTPFAWSESLLEPGAWPFAASDDDVALLVERAARCSAGPLVPHGPSQRVVWPLRRHPSEHASYTCHLQLFRRA